MMSLTCFDEKTRLKISNHSETFSLGTKVISISYPLDSEQYKAIDCIEGHFSWGKSIIYIQEKMLEKLEIQNFAILNELTIDFTQGFTVITGETGAGKSLVCDAIQLVLGGKSDPKLDIRHGQTTAKALQAILNHPQQTQSYYLI